MALLFLPHLPPQMLVDLVEKGETCTSDSEAAYVRVRAVAHASLQVC